MKKTYQLLTALFIGFALLLPVSSVLAAENVLDQACAGNADATLCGANNQQQDADCNSIFGECGVLTKAAGIVSIVVGVASVILIIVGSIQYIIASGDSTNIQNAKNTILYAIIGLVITLLARGIIAFVLVRL